MSTGNESERVIDWLYWDRWYARVNPRQHFIARAELSAMPLGDVGHTDPFYASRKLRQREQDARDEAENQRIWEAYWTSHNQ